MTSDSFDLLMKFGFQNKPNLKTETFDLNNPAWNQEEYYGRLQHNLSISNLFNLFKTAEEVNNAKEIVTAYKKSKDYKDLPSNITYEKLWRAKYLTDAYFHPQNGKPINPIFSSSAIIPINTLINASMITFQSNIAFRILQLVNQSYNCFYDSTNNINEKSEANELKWFLTNLTGVVGGMAIGLKYKSIIQKRSMLMGRMTPFLSVVIANCITIPLFREFANGTQLIDNDEKEFGIQSAKISILKETFSKICIASPLALMPLITRKFSNKNAFVYFPINLILSGLLVSITYPLGAAIYKPIKLPIKVSDLENNYVNKDLK